MATPWLEGLIVRGDGRGRTLGTPTANVELDDLEGRPPDGVYAAHAYLGEKKYIATMHVGPRPTFNASATVEIHLLDFPDRDLYDQRIAFGEWQYLRDIYAFPDAAALIVALQEDARRARELLGS